MSSSGTRRTRLQWFAALCCVALLAAGCGTRLSRAQILAENTVTGSVGAGSGAGGAVGSTGGVGVGSAADQGGPGGTVFTGATGGSSGSNSAAGTTGGGQAIASGSGGSGGGSATSGQGGAAAGTPIVIGFIGYLSGFGSSTAIPPRDAFQAWVKMVNAAGGINGHPVQLLVGDDGGSASADVSIAQQFVQNQGAVALSWASTDPSAIASFAQSHSVPVVGSEEGGPAWYQNPYMFPTSPDQRAGLWGAVRIAKNAGATKVATIVCVESPAVCSSTDQLFTQYAQEDGVQVVYHGQVSLTQPDYTADCLQTRSSGAQLVFMALDDNSVIRFTQSCARQGYNPIWMTGIGDDSMAKFPQLDGMLSAIGTFPWTLHSGSPGLVEYYRALQQYAPTLLSNGFTTQSWGWTSAKVLQEAITLGTAHLKPSDKVTSQNILTGLWSMRNDTVDGLLPGQLARTYIQGKPTDTVYCAFEMKVAGGQWTAPQGLTPICR